VSKESVLPDRVEGWLIEGLTNFHLLREVKGASKNSILRAAASQLACLPPC